MSRRGGILLLAARSWPSQGGIEGFMRRVAHRLRAERQVRIACLLADDRPMTRALQHGIPPSWPLVRDGELEIASLSLGPDERRELWPMRLWRARVPAPIYPLARRLSARVYPRAVGPAVARAASGTELIHVFGADMLGLAALQAGAQLGIPVVVSPFAHPGAWGDDGPNRQLLRGADAVVALLEEEAQLYRSWGVPAERVHVVGLWTDLAIPGPVPALIPNGPPVVLFLGVRRPYKGYQELVSAMPLVWAKQPETIFVFAGPGEAALTGTDPRVLDLGSVDEPTKAALLQRAALLCLPSRSEILPTVVLEAWLSGRPVVTSNIPTLAELVGEAGELTGPGPGPLAEALLRLLADPGLARQRAASGSERLRTLYSPEAVMGRLEAVYRSVSPAPRV